MLRGIFVAWVQIYLETCFFRFILKQSSNDRRRMATKPQLLIIMKKAFHTVLRSADPSFSPTHTPHTHMHKHTETSLKVTLSQIRAVAEICIWMPTFVGKFKGPWGFCKFCSEPGGPMGTKSHISKALPASIMAQRIGLIVLQQATFSAGCVYLSLSGCFLYLFQR